MPAPVQSLTPEEVDAYVRERCFEPAGENGLVGVELEWLTVRPADPGAHVDFAAVNAAVAHLNDVAHRGRSGGLPGGGRITYEPGGQVEVSSAPLHSVAEVCTAAAADRAALASALAGEGIALVGLGLDPVRSPRRVIEGGRYDAMETYFDRAGPEGRRMMCSTAAIQVNVGLGPGEMVERRWRLAHQLGPTLAATFANSPLMHGVPSGWASGRLAAWRSLDRTRQGPVPQDAPPTEAWARYALDAQVMLIRTGDRADRFVPILDPLPFGRWMREGHELGFPTVDDFAYHLTTLFPFVRPRGWLEMRMFDSLPDPWWRVPVAVTAALLFDEEAGETARVVSKAAEGMWSEAARHGLSHLALADAARGAFAAALEALPRIGADPPTARAAADFFDRYTDRGRCPADDRLQTWTGDGSLHPFDHPIDHTIMEATWT